MKFETPLQSKNVQIILFCVLKFRWNASRFYEKCKNIPDYFSNGYLYIHDGFITIGSDINHFEKSDLIEINPNEILDLKLDDK